MQEYIVLLFAIFIGMYFIGPLGVVIALLAWVVIKKFAMH